MEGAEVFPLLAIPLCLGYLLARRCLQRTNWPEILAEAVALSVVITLVGVNAVYRLLGSTSHHGWTSLELSVASTLLGEAVLIAALAWKAPASRPCTPLPRLARLLLGGLALAVVFYANAQQIANPDDDYWIHAPLQGLMRHGNFPPFNPFFSDIAMNGHYGRNLSIVTFSLLSGCDVFVSQHLMTSLLQVVTLFVFFSAFRRSSGSWRSGLLATVFVFFGINAGGRGGLIDTMQNNNAYVHLYLALLLSLLLSVWQGKSRWAAVLAGLTLGSYAIVYETHFGLVFLTVAALTPIFWARRLIGKDVVALSAAALAISLPLAFTQGGPLTDLLQRRHQGREHNQAELLSKGMQNQAQVVKVSFPKEQLFQILLETGEYQRVAHIYTMDTPLKLLHQRSIARGYAYIWSWDVLKLHFLPLYLFPFALVVLWKRGSLAGHFMGAFGTISFLVPALVNFGPIYESEYYRWEFAAALGFTAALGLALATLVEPGPVPECVGQEEASPAAPEGAFRWRGSDLVVSRRGLALGVVAAITVVNSWACLSFVSARLTQALSSGPSAWLVFPSTQSWLQEHQVLGFDELDYQAAAWLGKQVEPGDRLLTNFGQENNFSILYESTLTGLSGARCVGHALPLEDEKIGTTPFRRAPAAVAFWDTYRGDPLSQLRVDWLLYRDDEGRELPPLPGAVLAHRVQDGPRLRLIYQIDPELLPRVGVTQESPSGPAVASSSSDDGLTGTLEGAPPVMRGGHEVELVLELGASAAFPKLSGVLELSTVRLSDGLKSSASENLRWRLVTPPKGKKLLVPFVPPYDEGRYKLQATWYPDAGTPECRIAPTEIDVAFAALLAKIRIGEVLLPDGRVLGGKEAPLALGSRTLITPRTRLELPNPWPTSDQVLACWAFYSPERKEFDLLPGVNLQKVKLGEPDGLSLPFVTPERPGDYRLALYVSAGQGQLTRIPAGSVRIAESVIPQGRSR